MSNTTPESPKKPEAATSDTASIEPLDADEERAETTEPTPPAVPASVHVSRGQAAPVGDEADRELPTEPSAESPVEPVAEIPAEPVAEPVAETPVVPVAEPVAETAVAATTFTPVYVTAPTPPKAKGNRGIGILIAVLAAIAYAVVYAAVSLGYFALNLDANTYLRQFQDYVVSWAFWVPVVVFFLMFVLLVAIVNRGGWWAYVLGGLAVAVVVYFAYIGGALLEVKAWTGTVEQADRLIAQLWVNPLMLGAAIVAREVTIWFGKWIAARGKRVRERNLDAQRAFDREVAEGPLAQRPAASAGGAAWSER